MLNQNILINKQTNQQPTLKAINQKIMAELQQGKIHISKTKLNIGDKSPLGIFNKTLQNKQISRLKNTRSQYSLQDRKLIIDLKKKMQLFQQSIRQKQQILRKENYQRIKQQLNSLQLIKKQHSKKHKQQVIARKHKRIMTQNQQLQKHKQIQLNYKVSNKSRIYLLNQQEQKQKMIKEEQERKKILNLIAQNKRNLVNISQLKQYQSNYVKYLKNQKRERKNRLLRLKESQVILQRLSTQKKEKSRFYLLIQKELQNQKKLSEQKIRKQKQKQERLKQFLQNLKYNKIKRSKKQNRKSEIVDQSPKRVERSYTQQRQIGNKFMLESFKLANHKKPPYQTKQSTSVGQSTSPQKPNYLKEIKQRRLKNKGEKKGLFCVSQAAISNILNSSDKSEKKLQKLKKIAYQLQAGFSNQDPFTQIEKIKAKMFILQSALQHQV